MMARKKQERVRVRRLFTIYFMHTHFDILILMMLLLAVQVVIVALTLAHGGPRLFAEPRRRVARRAELLEEGEP